MCIRLTRNKDFKDYGNITSIKSENLTCNPRLQELAPRIYQLLKQWHEHYVSDHPLKWNPVLRAAGKKKLDSVGERKKEEKDREGGKKEKKNLKF